MQTAKAVHRTAKVVRDDVKRENKMTIYFIILGAVIFFGAVMKITQHTKTGKLYFLTVTAICMTLIVGLRGNNVGEDTAHYLYIFNEAQKISWMKILRDPIRIVWRIDRDGYKETIETSIIIACKVIGFFTQNGRVFLIIVAGLTFGLIAKFISDNADEYFWPVYIVLTDLFFMYAFNGIRQILAVTIAAQAFALLRKKKMAQAIFVLLLASYVHSSAIICFALIPIMMIKPKKEYRYFKYLFVIALGLPALIILSGGLMARIMPRYAGYLTYNFWTNSIGGSYLLYSVEACFIIMMYKEHFKKSDKSFQLSVLTLLFISLMLGGLQISMLERLSQYFRIYVVLFIPETFKYVSSKNLVFVKMGFFMLLFLLYFSYMRTDVRQYYFCFNEVAALR